MNNLKTPVYVIDEKKLKENCKILRDVQDKSGAKILLAQKAFSAYSTYPLIAEYLSGTTSSGLFEAKLANEEFYTKAQKQKIADGYTKKDGDFPEIHVFEPAFHDDEMEEICSFADHIVFNSLNQLEHHRKTWEKACNDRGLSAGLRINPEFSTQEDHEIYDPCAPGSRLGIRLCDLPSELPTGVEGLHFHTLCEQGFEPLKDTFEEFESKFGKYLSQIKWLNLGGGHHITRDDYNREGLVKLLKYIKDTYKIDVYLEPGEAIALNAGYLVTTVMDIVETEKLPVLILDTSAACHMPDVLEMPYRPPLRDSGEIGDKSFGYRLSSRTCLAGDVIGDYSFDHEMKIGDRLTFEDMAIYSMVKNNTFNGMPLPDIAILHEDGSTEVVKHFGYDDFKMRL
ncbi:MULTISPECIES: carboxynorspermidine decarboxylase [unclassified Butyrivibrio]|uniref:carboxynorspermidine decarboxylase n=1 Tax=unclassified Butyrivibrio TaxID=2639466 RepID=UPI0008870482|nr:MULTISPECIES: carboxynorspermidine decarboxylase [unclassified Butyrivibrio]SDB30920.1 carboxynorspermidine decarboxylase [Butyrivibrio sp. INlla16]SEK37338.1 carboxynorspermidine decarboxylase [Butyrivibrio sp. ob235]